MFVSKTDTLKTLIRAEQFRKIEMAFRAHFDLSLETIDLGGKQIPSHCSSDCQPDFCKLLCSTKTGEKRCIQDRIRSLRMAFETGQPYSTLCHAGIIFSCVPIMNNEIPFGGIFLGKCLSEPFGPAIEEDLKKRLLGLRIQKNALIGATRNLPVLSARYIHEAIEFLFIMLYDTTGLDPRVIQWKQQKTLQQSRIGEIIHQQKVTDQPEKYPFHREQELLAKVKIGDKTGAREILNLILGNILFRNPGQLNILKVRLVELLSILSRSASESGVDSDILLEKNSDYINRVITLETQEDICVWISRALDDFIDSVYQLQKSQKDTRLKPVLDYLQKNHKYKISLDMIAKAAHLSVSRLCHLFKEEFNSTVFDYLTGLRINRTKHLLLSTDKTCMEICFDSGFNNLSYFNRTFKQRAGMTPTQFRNQTKSL
ncbi:MAG: helix-turn-helix domain-containing protein [Planctomycetes bacterium]|nr:helix-turn-helix domain-containing protein [Planctomycetota bacterium]